MVALVFSHVEDEPAGRTSERVCMSFGDLGWSNVDTEATAPAAMGSVS